LSFWGSSKKFVWSFHKWGNGVCAFLHVNFEKFLFSYFEIPKSSISLVILGVFNFFCVKFIRGELWYYFSFGNFKGLLFWYIEILKSSIFFSFWESSKNLCEIFTSEETWYVPFFMWILKVFYFRILKIWNLQFSSCHFGGFTWGKIMLGVYIFLIWGFSYLFWCNSRIFNFVFRNFKGFSKNI